MKTRGKTLRSSSKAKLLFVELGQPAECLYPSQKGFPDRNELINKKGEATNQCQERLSLMFSTAS